MNITCVTIDCRSPEVVAAFWSEALGWGGAVVSADGGGAICAPGEAGMYLEFVRVPEDKTIKNRVHLGCSTGGIDEVDAEIERLEGLGATIAWEEQFPTGVAARYRNVVLRDPEGNEFCLGAGRSPSS